MASYTARGVQRIRDGRRRPAPKGEIPVLTGMVFCADRAEKEPERQSFSKVPAELVSDDPDLDAEMTSWMNVSADIRK